MTDSRTPGARIRRFDGTADLAPAKFRNPAVTIGMFDGLHRGHRHVIEHLRAFADRLGGDAVVVTFETHPMAVIRGGAPRKILSTEHRVALLERLDVDAVVLLPFDDAMRAKTYDAFVKEILVDGIGAKGILFGYNSNFGHKAAGTVETVTPLGEQHGFEVAEAPPITLHGEPISSSRIRDALEAGDLFAVGEMLGRQPALHGRVVQGDGRGKALGFPTANVDLEGELVPPAGVYQVVVDLRGQRYTAIANLGYRPTFEDARPEPLLEVHIPNVDFDFYGERIEVELVRKIRDERKFPSKDALVAQIRADVASIGLTDP